MKHMILIATLLASSLFVQAKPIPSDAALSINASTIDQVIRLVDKRKPGSSHEKVSIVVTDDGMSTDVSPRYKVYLTYMSYAEMGNVSTSFLISDDAFQFISATRQAAGIYVVKAIVYDDRGMVEVTKTIDATQMFIDEDKYRKNCGGDFCDGNLNTTVDVTETWKEARF